jgi:hypothetical protein
MSGRRLGPGPPPVSVSLLCRKPLDLQVFLLLISLPEIVLYLLLSTDAQSLCSLRDPKFQRLETVFSGDFAGTGGIVHHSR